MGEHYEHSLENVRNLAPRLGAASPVPGGTTPFSLKGPVTSPRVLLLQGPVGPFFSVLQDFLDEAGFETWRVAFNAGDLLYSRRRRRIRFREGPEAWERWIDAALASGSFGCVILFGSERPAHRAARKAAERYGLRVISLEEGYIRPGYVTIEEGGNNAASPLSRRLPVILPDRAQPSVAHYPRSQRRMARYAASYYTARALHPAAGDQDLHHRPAPLLSEAWCWTRNVARRVRGGERNFRRIERLLENHDRRFFLVPLQVARDANMGRAALGWTSEQLVKATISSFARRAPEDTRLVFKIHPMERGHSTVSPLIHHLADEAGVAERVDIIDTGSLGLLTRHAAGMITITSTSGLSAIHHGTPLLVVGDAFYAHPALASCARGQPDFDRFWNMRHVAGAQLRRGYLDWVRREALKPGDFYCPDGMTSACRGVLARLAELEAASPCATGTSGAA